MNPTGYYTDAMSIVIGLPTAHYYKDMLRLYPDSLFILTVRDPDEWYTIASTHYRKMEAALGTLPIRVNRMLRSVLWSDNYDHKVLWTIAYNRHNREVQRVIPKDQLLVMHTSKREGYEELCGFLENNLDNPCQMLNNSPKTQRFPHTEINDKASLPKQWRVRHRYSHIDFENVTQYAYVSMIYNPNIDEQRATLKAFLISVESLRRTGLLLKMSINRTSDDWWSRGHKRCCFACAHRAKRACQVTFDAS